MIRLSSNFKVSIVLLLIFIVLYPSIARAEPEIPRTSLTSIVTRTESEYQLEIPILEITVPVKKLEIITTYPNGTKEIFISLAIYEINGQKTPFGEPWVRVNSTKVIKPKTVSQKSLTLIALGPFSREELLPGGVLHPPPIPEGQPPPLDESKWKKYGETYLLLAGQHVPKDGSDPFVIKYKQPDNKFNYHPKELDTPWAYLDYTTNIIYAHIPLTKIYRYIDGIEDEVEFYTYVLGLFGVGIGAAGGLIIRAAKLLAAKALITAGVATSWTAVGVALVLIGALIEAFVITHAYQGYVEKDFVEDKIQTYDRDGFAFLKIQQGVDYGWFYPYESRSPNIRPGSVSWFHQVRNYDIAWGSEFEEDEWEHYAVEAWYSFYCQHGAAPEPPIGIPCIPYWGSWW